MTGIVVFNSPHGAIAIEVEESFALSAGVSAPSNGYVEKGVGEVVARSQRSFCDAMETMRAYAASLDDIVQSLPLAPEEVSFEFNLKMSGSVGFVIAKAGAESEMKVSLTWAPRKTAKG